MWMLELKSCKQLLTENVVDERGCSSCRPRQGPGSGPTIGESSRQENWSGQMSYCNALTWKSCIVIHSRNQGRVDTGCPKSHLGFLKLYISISFLIIVYPSEENYEKLSSIFCFAKMGAFGSIFHSGCSTLQFLYKWSWSYRRILIISMGR